MLPDSFLLQIVVSTFPVVLFFSTFPVFSGDLGITAEKLGLFFLLVRVGTLLGAQLSPFVLRKFSARTGAIGAEIFNFVIASATYSAILRGNGTLVLVLILFKSIPLGLVPNLRVHWLKVGYDAGRGQRILLLSQVLIQASYGLGGLLLILVPQSPCFRHLAAVDAITSLAGAALFASAKASTEGPLPDTFVKLWRAGSFGSPARVVLLTSDLLAAICLGGTNYFLVQLGQTIKIGRNSGYGTTLVIYATAFAATGYILQKRSDLEKSNPLAISAFATLVCGSIALLRIEDAWVRGAALFAGITGYSALLLLQSSIWFRILGSNEVAPIFALRSISVGLISALMERLYAGMDLDLGLQVRMLAAVA